MKLITKLLNTSLVLAGLASIILVGSAGASSIRPMPYYMAMSPAATEACQGVNLVTGNSCNDNGGQLNTTLTTIINIFSIIVGVVAVIMIIIAGLQFITSGGNPQSVSKARASLTICNRRYNYCRSSTADRSLCY